MCGSYDPSHVWFPTLTQAVDIITDSSCSRTMEPDTALCSGLSLDVTIALVAAQATQFNMVVAWPLDTNMVPGD